MATTAAPGASLIGASIRRKEDPRFITGKGRYTDDVTFPGQTYAAFVRSPHANATIISIDASAALAMPGVHAVLTGEDMKRGGVNPIPPGWLHPGIKIAEFRPLAVGKVAHVGNAVAVVIADSPTLARDAADQVMVDYLDHPAVADAVSALAPGAPQVHPDAPGNVVFTWALGDAAATDAAIAGAATVVKMHLVNQRLIANAIEPRASLANYDSAADELTLYVTSQNPHVHRLIMGAFVLGLPEHKFRVIAPDVGGGFGSKIFIYPEECVVAWASKTLGRPVKWTATRSESFLTDAHGRDHDTDVEMAFDSGGQDRRAAREDGRQPRRVPHALRARRADVPLRHAAVRAVQHPGHPCRRDGGVHAHDAGRCVSRRRPSRGDVPARADDGRCRPSAGHRSRRVAAPQPDSAQTPSRSRRRWRCSTTAGTTSRRSTRRWR